jgi:glutamyl-tRNA reductase
MHRRRNRPMFFIDIAVPRDVDPAMNKIEGIFVYDIDDLQQVAASHIAERKTQAGGAEALVEAEVERFHQRRRAVNVAPAIVTLQRQAEEIRVNELKRMHAKLGNFTEEQLAAVEALTRGLVNKFLHPPMQALKQAARENDSTRVEALCETWSLPATAESDQQTNAPVVPITQPENKSSLDSTRESKTSAVGGK